MAEFVTVFINGVATEVPKGPFDMRAMCGQDFVLFHSSGVPIPVNEYGFVLETLQHGESYFLVSFEYFLLSLSLSNEKFLWTIFRDKH